MNLTSRLPLFAYTAALAVVFCFLADRACAVATGDDATKTASAPASRAAATPAVPLLEKVVVIGASASAGFEFGNNHPLASYVDAMLQGPHEKVRSKASELFFLTPVTKAGEEIEFVLDANPSLVIAADFLFWFCYGVFRTEKERLDALETGLKYLESIPCRVLVGAIPDMSPAVGSMLSKTQMPALETLKKANERIREWATKRPGIVVFDLPSLLDTLRAGESILIRGNVYEKGSTRRLMQKDNLHPTDEGTAVLAVIAMDAIVSADPTIPEGALEWNAKTILERGNKQKVEGWEKSKSRARFPESAPASRPGRKPMRTK